MNLDLKDVVYLLVYIITVAAIIITDRNRLSHLEKAIERINKVLFTDSGALNFVSQENCKSRQDHVYTAIRRGENNQTMMLKKSDTINENVLKIMFYLKMEKKEGD